MKIPLVELETSSIESVSYNEIVSRYHIDFIAHAKSITKPIHCKDARILKALELIEQNFKESISLQMIAEHVGLSGTVLSKMIKKTVGYSYLQIVIEVRVAKAMRMIRSTNHSLTSIAQQCGFNNPRSFTRIFRKCIGMRPIDFKKMACVIIFPKDDTENSPTYLIQVIENKAKGNNAPNLRFITPEEVDVLKQMGFIKDTDQN